MSDDPEDFEWPVIDLSKATPLWLIVDGILIDFTDPPPDAEMMTIYVSSSGVFSIEESP